MAAALCGGKMREAEKLSCICPESNCSMSTLKLFKWSSHNYSSFYPALDKPVFLLFAGEVGITSLALCLDDVKKRARVPTWLIFPPEQVEIDHYLPELFDGNSQSFGVFCDFLLFDVMGNYPFLLVSLFSYAKLLRAHHMNGRLGKRFPVPWRWGENWSTQLRSLTIDFKRYNIMLVGERARFNNSKLHVLKRNLIRVRKGSV